MCAAEETTPVKIAIASDHAAYALKTELAEWLAGLGHEVADLGTDGEESVDYPDYGYALAEHLAAGHSERGIALCGSGIGITIAMNRNSAVRCALVSEPLSARLSRTHNDANAIALGERHGSGGLGKGGRRALHRCGFSGGRHSRRVEKLSQITQDA